MRVPGDHTPVSQGTAECNHPLWCPPMYIHIHGVCTCEHPGWAGATTLECDVGAPVTPPHPPETGGGPPSRSFPLLPTIPLCMVHSSSLLWENGWYLSTMRCKAFEETGIQESQEMSHSIFFLSDLYLTINEHSLVKINLIVRLIALLLINDHRHKIWT